jgi:hypothetical protein
VIVFAFFVCVFCLWMNYRASPYAVGRRLLAEGKACEAAAIFVSDIREDSKSSAYSVFSLIEIQEPCALRELVALLDLPDGEWVRHELRAEIWKAIRARVSGAGPMPPFDPAASREERARQRRELELWLEHRGSAPSSSPASSRPTSTGDKQIGAETQPGKIDRPAQPALQA